MCKSSSSLSKVIYTIPCLMTGALYRTVPLINPCMLRGLDQEMANCLYSANSFKILTEGSRHLFLLSKLAAVVK